MDKDNNTEEKIQSNVEEAISSIGNQKEAKPNRMVNAGINYSKEISSLKRARYNDKKESHSFEFVMQNTKNGKIASVRAETALQASLYLGWRARHSKVLEKNIINEK